MLSHAETLRLEKLQRESKRITARACVGKTTDPAKADVALPEIVALLDKRDTPNEQSKN